jgi:septal ring factor EnvC (AmiA/AmiB activator)
MVADKRLISLWCALLVLCVCWGGQVCGQSPQSDSLPAQLEQIRAQVVQLEEQIRKADQDSISLHREEQELQLQVEQLELVQDDLAQRVQQAAAARDEANQAVGLAQQRVTRQRALLSQRLRALYMSSSTRVAALHLHQTAAAELERSAVYIGAVRRFDQAVYQGYLSALVNLEQQQAALTERMQAEQEAHRAAVEKEGVAQETLDRLRVVRFEIEERRARESELVSRLKAEATRLEGVLRRSLSGAERGGADGQGLFTPGLAISAPVRGDVVRRFGKAKIADLSQIVMSKGLEYVSQAGSPVYAVSAGRVAFVGPLPGYGSVVVVDHGGRSYSLYGRLGAVLVRSGEGVRRDAVIGNTSALDGQGRNFYFEVRKNGVPIDPEKVLSRLRRE